MSILKIKIDQTSYRNFIYYTIIKSIKIKLSKNVIDGIYLEVKKIYFCLHSKSNTFIYKMVHVLNIPICNFMIET